MKRKTTCLAALVISVLAASRSEAVEPAQAFLDGLRERGYFDVAIEYLNAAQNNPNVPVQFKETLPYEKGVTLVKGARQQRDPALREKQLDEGQQVLTQFVTSQPNHLLSVAARSELGNVIVERARSRVEKSSKVTPADKATLLKEANGLYTEAVTTFTALSTELKEKLKGYPAAMDEKKDAKRVEERDRFRQDFLQSQLLVAAAREEMVETLPKGSKEWTDTLTQATADYKDVYEKYRTRLAGLYARMYQGRCLYKLGKPKEASAIFGELLANPDEPDAFRTLKVKAMALAVESWAAQGLSLEIIDKAGKLVDTARPTEDRTDEVMGMRLAVARACKAYAAELAKKTPRDPQIKLLLTNGRKLVTYVQKFPGDHQEAARKLLPEFSGGDAEAIAERKEPKDFTEARTLAKEAIDAMQSSNLLIKTLPGRIATIKDAAEKADLEKQLEEARTTVGKAQQDALYYCRLASKLVNRETDIEDVNLIRYLLCYLLYNEASYNDAVILGEFLARRYPESQGARPSAKIAMASYLKLYTENQTDDKAYESAKIISIADYIVKKWPDQPEAPEALNTLIPFMIREKKLKEAQDYLGQIPADSPHRGNAELKTGQALWASYLDNSQQIREWENDPTLMPEGTDLAARKAELAELKSKAKQTLVDGVGRMQASGEVNNVMATAVLSLAQIYVDTNEAAKAVTLLEDPKVGVLTLVKNNDESVNKPGFPEETYKTALRAYISSLAAGGGDAAASVEKAKAIMESLKQQMGKTPEGQARLVAIYVSLARDLQRQMEIADPEVKKSLGLGFETFLKEVAADATELNILNWVAETYRGMGESFGTHIRNVPQDSIETAKKYYGQAADTYQKILDMGKAKQGFLTPAMTTQLRLQLAKTKRSMGDYVASMDMFEAILKAQPSMLPVQIEAARTYQDWGSFKDSHENYMRAIVGGRPDKNNADPNKKSKNIIWGWGEIARMTAPTGAGSSQYKDQFHEARYNLALSRYNYAVAQKDATEKKKNFQRAKTDIAVIAGFYPDLGGDKWKGQYDALLKNIQKALGERPLGLQALQTAAPAAAAPAGSGAGKTVPTSAPAPGKPAPAAPASTTPAPAKGKAAPAKPKAATTNK
jgi:hypothetical protein